MASGPSSTIKLRARDLDDMRVVAAWLQDALVPLRDMAFLKSERRFVMVANRFKWESGVEAASYPPGGAGPDGDASFEDAPDEPAFARVNCGVCFDRVRAVKSRALDRSDRNVILNLLSIRAEPGALTLLFSGGPAIRLEVSAIACHLEDIGEPWPTHWRPSHDGDSEQSEGDVAGLSG